MISFEDDSRYEGMDIFCAFDSEIADMFATTSELIVICKNGSRYLVDEYGRKTEMLLN